MTDAEIGNLLDKLRHQLTGRQGQPVEVCDALAVIIQHQVATVALLATIAERIGAVEMAQRGPRTH